MSGRSWVGFLSGSQSLFFVPRSCHVDQFTFHISLPTELTIYHLCLLIAKLHSFQNLSLGFILKIFLKFRKKFQPRYSKKYILIEKKKSVEDITPFFLGKKGLGKLCIDLSNAIPLSSTVTWLFINYSEFNC